MFRRHCRHSACHEQASDCRRRWHERQRPCGWQVYSSRAASYATSAPDLLNVQGHWGSSNRECRRFVTLLCAAGASVAPRGPIMLLGELDGVSSFTSVLCGPEYLQIGGLKSDLHILSAYTV